MGILITKFRKKKTVNEVLEKLEDEIKSIEDFRRSTEQMQKKIVARFVFISVCVYCIIALILYFYFLPASAYERIIYTIPLVILPVILILLKSILTWYYNRKIRKNQKKLSTLKDEKKKILEEVMDKETYKVAKTILEKYAPEQVKRNPPLESTPVKSGPLVPIGSAVQSQTGLRHRGQFPATPNRLAFTTPALKPQFSSPGMTGALLPKSLSTPLPLPRAILPRDRTVLDKMVDYLVGDGPSNRYALICKQCSSHNGMALKEEFDYLSFRCCYCLAFNPARKKRPIAPKLNASLSIKSRSDASNSDSDSETDSEGNGPIITEPPSDSPELEKEIAAETADSDKLSDVEKVTDVGSSAMEVDSSQT